MERTLPDFEDPPVVEVALSVQFEKLTGLRSQHIGLLWLEYKHDDYPEIEEQQPIGPVNETFPSFGQPTPKFRLEFQESPSLPRFWFLNSQQSRLIQIQNDRFVYNWRKAGEDETYPHFDEVKECFIGAYDTFIKFISDQKIGEIIPNQCEVTYVNIIPLEGEMSSHRDIDKVITVFNREYSESFPLELENAQIVMRHIINNSSDQAIGRLHISLDPVVGLGNEKAFLLKLIARGKPEEPDLGSTLKFFDLGNEMIVTCFTSITTKSMHDVWRRK